MESRVHKVHQKLRVGIMLDALTVPNWIYYLLGQLMASEYAELALVIYKRPVPEKISAARRLLTRLKTPGNMLFQAYVRVDRKLFCRTVTHDAFAPRDAQALLTGIKMMALTPLSGASRDCFHDADIAAVKNAELDVILRLGFQALQGEILQAAAYGVWSLHHDDDRYYRGGPATFWEMAEGNPETGSTLQIQTGALAQGQVIYRSVSATCFTSLFKNRNAHYWKTAQFMLRHLKALYREGWDFITAPPIVPAGTVQEGPVCREPGVLQMTRFLMTTGCRLLAARLRFKLFNEQWFLAISRRHGDILETIKAPAFQLLKPPTGHGWADPFVIRDGGKDFVFLEDISLATGKGIISVMTVADDNQRFEAVPVLERPYHLSYPFVFNEAGNYYMIPETARNHQVELYKSYDFPYDWRLERVLLQQINAVDATLYRQDGLFWLFVNVAPHGGHAQDELHVFYASRLDGEWTPHKLNPVVSHVGHARPAGRLFKWNGKLLRPAQNSIKTYGHHIVLNEIVDLTPDTYREIYFDQIMPDWLGKSLGTHTLNFSETLLVTDGKKNIFKFT